MGTYNTNVRFIHSMRDRQYLEQIFTTGGLMFTDHHVEFSLSSDPVDFEDMLNLLEPMIQSRASILGAKWSDAAPADKVAVRLGMMAVNGEMPMLCFTEALDERQLSNHSFLFGAYGIVVGQEWMEKNGGDRVIYAGSNSAMTRALHQTMVQLRLGAMIVNASGNIVFDAAVEPTILNLLQFIQVRKNFTEFEWRIPGQHGFLKAKSSTGTRLPISIGDIEIILVQNEADIPYFQTLLRQLGCKAIPDIVCQPPTLGSAAPN